MKRRNKICGLLALFCLCCLLFGGILFASAVEEAEISYAVRFLAEDLKGGYSDHELYRCEKSGFAGEETINAAEAFKEAYRDAAAKQLLTGFSYAADNNGNVESLPIQADGLSELTVYCSRNTYHLEFQQDSKVLLEGDYLFGAVIEPPDGRHTQEYTFIGWDKLLPQGMKMPAEDCLFKAQMRLKELVSFTLSNAPEQVTAGQYINLASSGTKIHAKYDNGVYGDQTIDVTTAFLDDADIEVSPISVNTPGEHLITVEFQGKSAAFLITVLPRIPQTVSVDIFPTKTVYTVGDYFDPAGGELLVRYNNGSQARVPMDDPRVTVSGLLRYTVGVQTLKVSYQDTEESEALLANFSVSVIARVYRQKGKVTDNGVGEITARDVLAVQRHILGLELLTGDDLAAAKVTGGDEVTARDVLAMQRHILKIELIK